MATIGAHAVVLGAGMGGLFAARALSDAYERVTIVERDRLPDGPRLRRGVPQGGHGHSLLPGGGRLIGQMFPGILQELEAAGVPVIRDFSELHFSVAGHVLRTGRPTRPLVSYLPSRRHLEWQVRRRVEALPNVQILQGCDVGGPITEDTGDRVTGVQVTILTAAANPETLEADLVVDAMGRGARTPAWLEQLGYGRPPEKATPVDVAYVTHLVRMRSDALREKLVLISAVPDRPVGLGLFRHEDDTWEFTLAGMAGHRPPADPEAMVRLAEDFAPPHVITALRAAESLADVAAHRFPVSRWRRYDRMRRFPAGLIAFGDALCSLNPTYGQGMSVAALQAAALATCVRDGAEGLPQRFFRAAAKQINIAWLFADIGDRPLLAAQNGRRSSAGRIAEAAVDRYSRAAEHDAALAERFLRVYGFIDSPTRLLSPSVPARVLLAELRRHRSGTAVPSHHSGHEPPPPEGLTGGTTGRAR